MTINTTQLRSIIDPVWHEISSLWSGVDFSFSDVLADSGDQAAETFFPRTISGGGVSHGHYEQCW